MNKTLMAAGLAVVLGACNSSKKSDGVDISAVNPFFTEYTTPFGVPPFEQIKVEHYKPAFLKGMEEQTAEVEAIVNNPDKATFENTIVALDRSGELLMKVAYAFSGQASVNTNDEIQALEQELSPLLSKHSDDISLNPKLFARVKSVYENQAKLNLDKEQKKLLEETYKGFVRGGANLDADEQAELRKLNEQISMLELTFGQNSLKETNAFQLVVDKKEDLSGLPETLIAAAATTAKEAGLDGKWVFTLHNPSVMPFLQYADNRALREKIYKAYVCRGNNNNANDNKDVIKKLVVARLEKAKLLGYEDFAAYVLEEPGIGVIISKKPRKRNLTWTKTKFVHTWSLTMSGKVLSMWRTNCMASLLLRCRTCRFPIRMPRFSNVRTRMVYFIWTSLLVRERVVVHGAVVIATKRIRMVSA